MRGSAGSPRKTYCGKEGMKWKNAGTASDCAREWLGDFGDGKLSSLFRDFSKPNAYFIRLMPPVFRTLQDQWYLKQSRRKQLTPVRYPICDPVPCTTINPTTEKVAFSQLRSDIQTHHNTEYQATRAEYERLSSEIAKLNSRLREEIIRAQNSVKLDLNLEKGRIREEASVHELKIKETDTRIETEVGMIRGTLEAVKFSTLQWLSM